MKKTLKEMMLVVATAAATLVVLSSSAAAACTPGNNGNGCSWTCSGATAQVTCQNTAVTGVVPRCYSMDTNAGTPGVEVPCSSFNSSTTSGGGSTTTTTTTATAASMLHGKTRGAAWLKKLKAPTTKAPVKKAAVKRTMTR